MGQCSGGSSGEPLSRTATALVGRKALAASHLTDEVLDDVTDAIFNLRST